MPVNTKPISKETILADYAEVSKLSGELQRIFRGVTPQTICLSNERDYTDKLDHIVAPPAPYLPYTLFGDFYTNSLSAISSYMMLSEQLDHKTDLGLFKISQLYYKDRIDESGIVRDESGNAHIQKFTELRDALKKDGKQSAIPKLDELESAAAKLYDHISGHYKAGGGRELLEKRASRDSNKQLQKSYNSIIRELQELRHLTTDPNPPKKLLAQFETALEGIAPLFVNPLAAGYNHKRALKSFATYCDAHLEEFGALHGIDKRGHLIAEDQLTSEYGLNDLSLARIKMDKIAMSALQLRDRIEELTVAAPDSAEKKRAIRQ